MKTRRSIVAGAAVIIALFSLSTQSAWWWPFSSEDNKSANSAEVTELGWEDLIPDDFVQPENPLMSMTQEEIDKLLDGSEESNAEMARLEQEFYYAPVVDELDGQRIKIPAYITPLEFDGQDEVKEFLLVPYVGACLHTPPPPANQVLHAISPKMVKNPGMYEAVWAIGTIRTETVKSVLVESGYKLEVENVIPYTEE